MYNTLFEQYLKQKLQNKNNLTDSVIYTVLHKGNRFRPLMTLMWCNIGGGKAEEALPLAAAIECIHTMSLIQDDLPCMDNAATRRNQPCLHLHTNESNAILTGDYLLALGFEFILTSSLDQKQKLKAIEVINNALKQASLGQNQELNCYNQSQEDYLFIHKNKTGSVLSAAAQLGAIAANREDLLDDAAAFGESLGIGYQILDDIRDQDGLYNILSLQELHHLLDYYKNISYTISRKYQNLQTLVERIFK